MEDKTHTSDLLPLGKLAAEGNGATLQGFLDVGWSKELLVENGYAIWKDSSSISFDHPKTTRMILLGSKLLDFIKNNEVTPYELDAIIRLLRSGIPTENQDG